MSLAGFSKEYRYRLALENIVKKWEKAHVGCSDPNSCMGECGACVAERLMCIARAALKGDE